MTFFIYIIDYQQRTNKYEVLVSIRALMQHHISAGLVYSFEQCCRTRLGGLGAGGEGMNFVNQQPRKVTQLIC